jgi:para-nitrobenzyl esterase
METSMRYGFLALLGWALTSLANPTPVVRTAGGDLRGELDGEILVFRGVPFAAPPVGDLRWRPPQPVVPWQGVREATAFSASCPQPPPPSRKLEAPNRTDEDCLYLNVWTPGLAPAKRPVMVWIHGGGMTIGSGTARTYEGTKLAEQGVVLVTLNYRLGVLGFMAHPELSAESPDKTSGNYGLLDQIAALRWVQDNIAAFGGDPENVTIFGESAGAVSVGCLLTAPAASGLFHRAILESGTPVAITAPLRGDDQQGEGQGLAIARRLHAEGIADLRAMPADRLVDGCPAAIGPTANRKGKDKFGPIVDGVVLPDAPMRLFAEGKFHHVPILLGTNRDEMTLFMGGGNRGVPKRKLGLRVVVKRTFPENADEVLNAFSCADDDGAFPAFRDMMTVGCFTAPCRLVARFCADAGVPVYLYEFSRVPPGSTRTGLGATHGIEIPYVFGTFKEQFGDATDRRLADAMSRYWTQFARNGAPQAEGLPEWPRYDARTDRHLELGDQIAAGRNLRKEQCDAMEAGLRERLELRR